ncbi:hypothetical protein BGX34_002858, partial [Mortierella sp. NVP85]
VSFSPSVLAQKFRPRPRSEPSYTFTEGQGLYILGGVGPDFDSIQQPFMLDLSVSWNTSDPVFKDLKGPKVEEGACTMTNGGEDLFVLASGTGYIYNVKSDTWAIFNNNAFASPIIATTDPETGFIHIPQGGEDFQGRLQTLTLDLRTKTVNQTATRLGDWIGSVAGWNTYLKSLVGVASQGNNFDTHILRIYTPSKMNKTSTGWSRLKTGPIPGSEFGHWNCGASMHGGTKMVFLAESDDPTIKTSFNVYILDVKTRTWKKGPSAPPVSKSACAATGDQFIVWGGEVGAQQRISNATFVYNIKTEKWTTNYIAPRSRSNTTTTTTTATASSLPSQTSNPKEESSSDKRLVVIIAVVIGILLAIILGFIFRYHRQTRRSNLNGPKTTPNGSSTDLLDVKEHSVGSSRRRDPSESGPNSGVHAPGVPGRLHQGSLGARELSEHPHAILEDPTARRNLQEGDLGAQLFSQHPHVMVGDEHMSSTPTHSEKVLQGYNRHYGGKEELRNQ